MTAQPKRVAEVEATGPFVINLCSSTTPMALAQPKAEELKRFNFFVSRRRADGRDRFHLHMGHFMTLAEAEEWVGVVRDIYPGAWAGEAPGKKLAQRAAAGVAPQISAAPVVPTLHAVPPPVATPVLAATQIAAAVPVPSQPKEAPAVEKKPVTPGSNVREVLKSLDDTGSTRMMPAPTTTPPGEPPTLSDTAVLKILEDRRTESGKRGGELAAKGIEMLRPDDTATVRALKEAVRENEPVSFAVQLQWSVQPIDLVSVPPLAIFSAYTLYTVEGSRDGRKWYGLRLGFFGDALSAKQVASYVRSEFISVAVIPVSTQERGRATDGDPKAASAAAARPRKEAERKADEFKLIDDATDDVVSPGLLAAQSQMKAKLAAPSAGAPIAKRKPLGRVRASEKRSARSLEETLEILGASNLEIDNGRGELLNDSGIRHLRVEQVQKNSPFSKLLERLTDRVRKA